jgi:predicted Zn-dependent protease
MERMVHRDRGDVLAARGQMEEAETAYRESQPPGTTEPEGSLAVVEALLVSGHVEAASTLLTRVSGRYPDHPRALYHQAQIDLSRQEPAEAERSLLAALKSGGEKPVIYYSLARAALMQEDEEKALAYLDRVFAADDPTLRRALRADRLFASRDRSPALRAAVERYLAGAAAPRGNGS